MNAFEMGRRKILGDVRFSMLFACGVGTGLFFYGVAEPIYHYTSGWSSSSSSSFYWHHHHHHPFLSPTSISKGKSHQINLYRTCWWTTSWPLSSKQFTSKSSQLVISDFPLSTWDEHSCTFHLKMTKDHDLPFAFKKCNIANWLWRPLLNKIVIN